MNHTAKLRTKKMRSNLLKRIQKQNSESPSKTETIGIKLSACQKLNQKLSQKPHQNQLTGRRSVLPPFIHMKTHIGVIADRALNGPQRTSELECRG